MTALLAVALPLARRRIVIVCRLHGNQLQFDESASAPHQVVQIGGICLNYSGWDNC
jgi:hypothetical protein